MKLSDSAKQVSVTYKTAYSWWKAGQLDAYQLPMGAIIVCEPNAAATGAALYTRVSWAEQRDGVTRQMQRLRDYAAPHRYHVVDEVIEIASGLHDERPKLKKLLTDARVGVIVVVHRDRLTRFGYGYIATSLEHADRHVEVVFATDTGHDTGDDVVAVITRMATRMYGRRNAKRRAAQIQACVKQCIEQTDQESPARASHQRRGLWRVPAATDLQSRVVWRPGARRRPLGTIQQDLFRLRVGR
jgi:predicted site-specific integrase-resolvase